MNRITAQQVEAEYADGRAYKTQVGVYENTKRNERFFIGDQWYGVNAPKDLDRPVFNILKRVVSYFVATVVSDDVAVQLSDFYGGTDAYLDAVTKQLEAVIEGAGIKEKNRDVIRNGAVDGDGCLYLYFDPEKETGQAVRGAIAAEVIDNTNLYFGNPYCTEVERQPYLLVSVRRRAEDIRREAMLHGMSQECGRRAFAAGGRRGRGQACCDAGSFLERKTGGRCGYSTHDESVRRQNHSAGYGSFLSPVSVCMVLLGQSEKFISRTGGRDRAFAQPDFYQQAVCHEHGARQIHGVPEGNL